ncbi:hypothetical protein Tco_0851838 [Tanacetum coccineum]
MACVEEIAKDAKLNKIEDQLLVLIRRQVETKLKLEEKFKSYVIAISVISVSSDSSEDSVGTPVGRVILFGTIPIPDTTPVITPPTTQTDTTSDPSEDPLSDHIPLLPAILPFLSSTNDTTDGDTPDIPPSSTHGMPFTKITSSTQRSPIIPRRRVMILAPGQPIPHGRPYRYHLNGSVHMMTAGKRVGPIPIQQLAMRHFVDHSLSDYFSPDDSARDSSSDSSSEASSDFHSDASSDSSLRYSLSNHSSPDLPSTSARPSRKRRRYPMTYVPASPPVFGALSPVRADLIPSPKRVRDSGYSADVKIIAKVGTVAYRLELPEKLSKVHSTFYVSNLKKCLADEPLAIPLDEIQVDDKLHFIKEPVEIMDREVKRLKQSRILIVKRLRHKL